LTQFPAVKLSIIAVAAAAAFGLAPAAHAQGGDNFAFGASTGIAVAATDMRDYHTNGVNGTLTLAIGAVDTPVGIRFDAMYNAFGDVNGTPEAPNTQGKARIFAITGNIVYDFFGQDTKLYLIAGVGGYTYKPTGAGIDDESDFGINAGLGVFLPSVNGFIEARFHNVYRVLPDPASGMAGKKSAQFYPITFGVLF